MRCIRIIGGIGLLLVAASSGAVHAGMGGLQSSAPADSSKSISIPVVSDSADAGVRIENLVPLGPGSAHEIGSPWRGVYDPPNRGYFNHVALAPGAVQTRFDAAPHIRGGETQEVAYYFDGFSLQDPFTGYSFVPFTLSTSTEPLILRPGGLGPEYGHVMSGIANLGTVGRPDRYRGSFLVSTDNFHGDNADYELYSGTLTGPLTAAVPGLSFSAAAEHQKLGTRNPGGRNTWDWQWSWRAKVDWKPPEKTYRVSLGGIGYRCDRHDIPTAWMFNAEHAPRYIDQNYNVWGRFANQFTPTTSLTLSANWFMAKEQNGDGVHFDDLWAYGRLGTIPRVDETGLFYAWDDMFLDPDSLAVGVYAPLYTEVRDTAIVVDLPDGDTATKSFILAGDEGALYNHYYQRKNAYLGARADLITAWSPGDDRHELLIGSEIQRHTVCMYEHVNPVVVWRGASGGFFDVNRYGYDELGEATDDAARPVNWAAYTRGNFNLGNVRVTAGLRLDYYGYDVQRLRDPADPLDPDGFRDLEDPTEEQLRLAYQLDPADLEDRDAEVALSPRLGIAIRVREGTSLHASYGRYVQRPRFEDVYAGYDFLEYLIETGKYSYTFGNPDLEPETVSATELGVQQRLTTDVDVGVTAFYKDYNSLVGAVWQPSAPYGFFRYDNVGDATAKGLEFQLRARPARGVRVHVNYTLQETRVTTPRPFPQPNLAWFEGETIGSRQARPRSWDRRHTLTLIAELHRPLPTNQAAGLFADPLGGAGLTVAFTAGSGFPYTSDGDYETGPAVYRLDLRAEKAFRLGRGAPDMGIYFWVINLLDRDNAVHVYPGTGEPDDTGWLDTENGQQFIDAYAETYDTSLLTGEEKYRLREADPANQDIPRQVRLGLWVGF